MFMWRNGIRVRLRTAWLNLVGSNPTMNISLYRLMDKLPDFESGVMSSNLIKGTKFL